MKKIVILGNMGYVGPVAVKHLRKIFPAATLVGYDIGFFATCLTKVDFLPELLLDVQYFGDARNVPDAVLENADAIINLAAISNDPMGNRYESITMEINHRACIRMAKRAKALGAKAFVFASSCSIYGATDGKANEDSNVNPLTAYAKSKVYSERDLKPLADKDFTITCLRFATACGMSPRLRLDLVLNDFVASAMTLKQITILSDGTPWRPLINVKDMALAIEWAVSRGPSLGDFLAINVGSQIWNYQVKQLAEAVAFAIPGLSISVNKEAPADKRSYQVNFDLFRIIAPKHQPQYDLLTTIKELIEGLETMNFNDTNFRASEWMRLKALTGLQEKGHVNKEPPVENQFRNFIDRSMRFTETKLKGAYLIDVNRIADERGFFGRSWCKKEFNALGLNSNVVQANLSFNEHSGTLRGMHYQVAPFTESKTIRCTSGAIFDVIIDLRPDSSTYKEWIGVELTAESFQMLYVPDGFAHGFVTLKHKTSVYYMVTQYYTPGAEAGIKFDDPAFKIEWPIRPTLISPKDMEHPLFVEEIGTNEAILL